MQAQLSNQQLMSVIETLTAIAKLGIDLHAVMTLVANQVQKLVEAATGAIVELAEGEDMVYRAVSNQADHLLGLRLNRSTSLSGMCIEQRETFIAKTAKQTLVSIGKHVDVLVYVQWRLCPYSMKKK